MFLPVLPFAGLLSLRLKRDVPVPVLLSKMPGFSLMTGASMCPASNAAKSGPSPDAALVVSEVGNNGLPVLDGSNEAIVMVRPDKPKW